MKPRRAHAKERFSIEATFDAPLPEGAMPLAEFAGPIGPGGPALAFWTTSCAIIDDTNRTRAQLIGVVPEEAPPGLYRVTHLEIHWEDDMPLSWVPAAVPLDALGEDVLIDVETTIPRRQPPVPRLIAAG